MIILKTSIEYRKYKKNINETRRREQDFVALRNFLSKSFEEEQKSLNNKTEFNQLEFFKSFLNSNEYLDNFINFLIAEYEKYSIENKSNDEIEKIAYEYFSSLDEINPSIDINLKLIITINTFYPLNTNYKDIIPLRRSLTNKINKQ